MSTVLSDYWQEFVSGYGRNSFHVAPRIFDLKPDRWEELSSIYYSRHGFKAPPKDDSYIGVLQNGREAIRSRRVDALVLENPTEMDNMAKFLHDEWLGKKAALAKRRSEDPKVVVLPPKPEPPKPEKPKKDDDVYNPRPNMPKKPTPTPLPPKAEEPKKKTPRPEWLVKFSLIFGALSSVAGVVAWFVPPLKAYLLAIVPLVQAVIEILGRLFT